MDTQELDRKVAEALGYEQISEYYWKDANGNTIVDGNPFSPSTNWEQLGELLEKHWGAICNELSKKFGNCWYVAIFPHELQVEFCRALIASLEDKGNE